MQKPTKPTTVGSFKRSPCAVANTLEVIGDKWTLLIIRDLFIGKTTYKEFQDSPESIPTNILAARLKSLAAHGLIDKKPYQDRPVRNAYTLTAKGKALGPVLMSMKNWGEEFIPGTQSMPPPSAPNKK
ncbi:MAG: winged helix-turn-helix transcriptional regulator [Thiohalomonadales bacterium]